MKTHGLEISLGPDTAELSVRCGLHSGPVTAGVLRGEKGRFQLFGDTMNTASRIESTGVPGKIHCSKDTADLLIEAGREKWVIKREDQVVAKGKGSLETFFVKLQVSSTCTGSQMSTASRASNNSQKPHRKGVQEQALMLVDEESGEPKTAYDALPKKVQRLVTWNVDMLAKSLKQVIARRASRGNLKAPTKRDSKKMASSIAGNVLDEVKDVLNLPQQFDAKCYENHVDPNSVELPDEVMSQLNDMISRIASLYHNNPFHNFERKSAGKIDSPLALSVVFLLIFVIFDVLHCLFFRCITCYNVDYKAIGKNHSTH